MSDKKPIKIVKLNESYSYIDALPETKIEIRKLLSVRDPDLRNDREVKMGWKSDIVQYSYPQNGMLVVLNGHAKLLLTRYDVTFVNECPVIKRATLPEVESFYNDVKNILPFEPYDFQYSAFQDSLMYGKQICIMSTSSGKSLTISMICEFYRRQGKKGLLLVPNIGLLTQFKNDIASYNLNELHDSVRVIGGGETERCFDSALTISTWQSLNGYEKLLDDLDYIICDELQFYASDHTSEIVKHTVNCGIKLGFTGTLPPNPSKKMMLLGLFGMPKTYITPRQLIDRGLATPVEIQHVKLLYEAEEVYEFDKLKPTQYPKKMTFIKEHELRTQYIVHLLHDLRRSGTTLALFQHTEHGKTIFRELMKKCYPDVEVLNKNITGKKSFEFQKEYGIYFLNGEDDALTREYTRKILEDDENATLVSNYALMSTGSSINRIHYAVLCSPIKTYTTVTQTIGRGMRLYLGKIVFKIFDIEDSLKTFTSQYRHRLKTSYNRESHPVIDRVIRLSAFFNNDEW